MEWFNRLIDLIFKDANLVLAFLVGAVAASIIAWKSNEAFRRLSKDILDALEKKNQFLKEEINEREVREARLEARTKELESAPEKTSALHATSGGGVEEKCTSGEPAVQKTPPRSESFAKGTGWDQVTRSLKEAGIAEKSIEDLKEAILNREIGLHDSDGRLRLRLWNHGAERTPVAILWRGKQNHRVLFPDGSDDIVKVAQLSEVSNDSKTL